MGEENSTITRRYHQHRLRLVAGLSLTAAGLSLVLGLTVLKPYLEGVAFVVWCGAVFCLALLALAMAVLDMADVNRQATADRRNLMRTYIFDKKFWSELEEQVGKQGNQQDRQTENLKGKRSKTAQADQRKG